MSDKFEASWAAFRSETPTNNQPPMRKAFHAGWDSRDAEVAAPTAQLGEAEERVVRLAGRLALTQIDRDKERDQLQATQAAIREVLALTGDIGPEARRILSGITPTENGD